MILQVNCAYLAEKQGQLQQFMHVFHVQRQYIECYIPAISAFSAEDHYEGFHWFCNVGLAGEEMAHFHPFSAKLMRACKLANFSSVEEFRTQWEQFVMKLPASLSVSNDGVVCETVANAPSFSV